MNQTEKLETANNLAKRLKGFIDSSSREYRTSKIALFVPDISCLNHLHSKGRDIFFVRHKVINANVVKVVFLLSVKILDNLTMFVLANVNYFER